MVVSCVNSLMLWIWTEKCMKSHFAATRAWKTLHSLPGEAVPLNSNTMDKN